MEGWGDKALPFLAVGRVKDGVTLASHFDSVTDEQKEQVKGVFKKLLQSGRDKFQVGQRIRLQWDSGSVCCFMDNQGTLLYCVVTSVITYPERLAYQLLYDLVVSMQALGESATEHATENSLNTTLKGKMRELVIMYEDPNNFPQFQKAIARARAGHNELGTSSPDVTSPTSGSRTEQVCYRLVCFVEALVAWLPSTGPGPSWKQF
jgi:hypothetical protein